MRSCGWPRGSTISSSRWPSPASHRSPRGRGAVSRPTTPPTSRSRRTGGSTSSATTGPSWMSRAPSPARSSPGEAAERRTTTDAPGRTPSADHHEERVRVRRRPVPRVPLEVVVGAEGVAGRADVADHVPLLDGSEPPVPGQVRVVHVPVLTEDLDREAAHLVPSGDGGTVEGCDDRRAGRRRDVVALMDVVPAPLLR